MQQLLPYEKLTDDGMRRAIMDVWEDIANNHDGGPVSRIRMEIESGEISMTEVLDTAAGMAAYEIRNAQPLTARRMVAHNRDRAFRWFAAQAMLGTTSLHMINEYVGIVDDAWRKKLGSDYIGGPRR